MLHMNSGMMAGTVADRSLLLHCQQTLYRTWEPVVMFNSQGVSRRFRRTAIRSNHFVTPHVTLLEPPIPLRADPGSPALYEECWMFTEAYAKHLSASAIWILESDELPNIVPVSIKVVDRSDDVDESAIIHIQALM